METPQIAEQQRARAVAEDYRRRGYDVVEEPSPESLPDFLAGYQPDLIARRGKETVVVEVKSRKSLADEPQVRELARLLQGKEHWSFELVVVPEEKPIAPEGAQPFTREDVLRGLEEAERLVELGFSEAAMLRAWATAEAALRIIAEEEGVKLERYAPSYMLTRAVSDGIISREEYAFFIRAMEYRNALVHGFSAASFDTNLVRKLIALIKQMIGHATAADLTKVAVELSEAQLENLQQEAGRLGVLPEELAGAVVSDLLRAPDREFQRIVDHILRKNEELYRRLS